MNLPPFSRDRPPRLLDLFCGAGGASMGYRWAGFDVVGVDSRPQPNYPFPFHRADALEFLARHGAEYDAIHASPPCQHYAPVTGWRGDRGEHPALIPAVLDMLNNANRPFVVENVPGAGAHLPGALLLCGSMFGLKLRRHRLFFLSEGFGLLPDCRHRASDMSFDHGAKQTEDAYRREMAVEWMTVKESRQAIPPAYTEWIGRVLLATGALAR